MADLNSRLHLPMRAASDVIPHLGASHHYQDGRSAKLTAEAWFSARGVPEMVRLVLDQATRLQGAELVDAFLERCTDLGDGRKPSQADILAVLGLSDELAIMALEGKVDEGFDKLVSEWIAKPSSGKSKRLSRLAGTLGVEESACAPLRYQLLHRTASAIYEAHRYRSKVAIMMVHSFDSADAGIDDFRRFAKAIGVAGADATRLAGPVMCEGVELYLGWAADRASSEGFSIVDGRKSDEGLFE